MCIPNEHSPLNLYPVNSVCLSDEELIRFGSSDALHLNFNVPRHIFVLSGKWVCAECVLEGVADSILQSPDAMEDGASPESNGKQIGNVQSLWLSVLSSCCWALYMKMIIWHAEKFAVYSANSWGQNLWQEMATFRAWYICSCVYVILQNSLFYVDKVIPLWDH